MENALQGKTPVGRPALRREDEIQENVQKTKPEMDRKEITSEWKNWNEIHWVFGMVLKAENHKRRRTCIFIAMITHINCLANKTYKGDFKKFCVSKWAFLKLQTIASQQLYLNIIPMRMYKHLFIYF